MPVKVLYAEDADMEKFFTVACRAFDRNEPVWDAFWPNHWTAEGRKVGGERMTLTKNSDPTAHYIKAVDEETGEIVGIAKWNIFQGQVPDKDKIQGSSGDYWTDPREKEYTEKMYPIFAAKRNGAIARTGAKIASLDVLAVDPAHQRKKVGDALTRWGVEKADELGLEACVESSKFGRGLYEKHGFVFKEDVLIEVPGFEDKNDSRAGFAWLERPKKA